MKPNNLTTVNNTKNINHKQLMIALGDSQPKLPPEVRNFIKRFFLTTKTPVEILKQARRVYPEMDLLVDATDATPEIAPGSEKEGATRGELVYGGKYDRAKLLEFDRNAVGTMNFKYVLMGEYDKFIACQKPQDALTTEGFQELRDFTIAVLDGKVESIDAMLRYLELMDVKLAYMPISDLGKTKSVLEKLKNEYNLTFADHDHAIAHVLQHAPEFLPSFKRLSRDYQEIITVATSCKVNAGQFIQCEMPSAPLAALKGMSKKAFDFWFMHFIYDVSGALGGKFQNGSSTYNINLHKKCMKAYEILNKVREGKITHAQAKTEYVHWLCLEFGKFECKTKEDFLIGNIIGMNRFHTVEEIEVLRDEYKKLDSHTRAILEYHFPKSGEGSDYAYLPYYGPAMYQNLMNQFKGLNGNDHLLSIRSATHHALKLLARVFQKAQVTQKGKKKEGVIILQPKDLASPPPSIDGSPVTLISLIQANAGLDVSSLGESDYKVTFDNPKKNISLSGLHALHNLSDLPANDVIIVAMGGGSDVVQGTILAKQAKNVGKNVHGIISVRTSITSDPHAGGAPKKREYEDVVMLSEGVYEMNERSSEKNGRFYENLPTTEGLRTLLVEYDPKNSGELDARLSKAKELLGKKAMAKGSVPAIYGVDTGGDVMYGFSEEVAKNDHSADQDVIVKSWIDNQKLGYIFVAAPGIDVPVDINTIVESNSNLMMRYIPNPKEKQATVDFYKKHKFDGSDPKKFGKTANAFFVANMDTYSESPDSIQAMTFIPEDKILSESNPRDPYVLIHEDTANFLLIFPKKK